MPEWLIFALVAWFAVKFLKKGQRRRIAQRERARVAEASSRPAVQAPRAETDEERLRRRYVAGEMTVEQYEEALDALYRGGGGG